MLKFYRILLLTLAAVFLASAAGIARYAADSCTQTRMYRQLAAQKEKFLGDAVSAGNNFLPQYRALYTQNNDLAGWIQIDGTNINYPVMWTPNNPTYYLKHSFEKEYSDYGVPYIDEDCVMGESNNYVIYGHHMKNETMFHDLCNYASKDFYDEHPIIKFDTLFGFGEYQIVAVFRFDTNNDTFRYNQFTDMDEEHFNNFMNSVHLRQLYDTGVDAEYGDHLITLSTCEYTYTNGRFVVVAKKV